MNEFSILLSENMCNINVEFADIIVANLDLLSYHKLRLICVDLDNSLATRNLLKPLLGDD